MQLSPELIRSFVDAVTPPDPESKETTVYATVKNILEDGTAMVRLDGADKDIPAVSSITIAGQDRVLVHIKDRNAIITGNLTEGSGSEENQFVRITNSEIEDLLSMEYGG